MSTTTRTRRNVGISADLYQIVADDADSNDRSIKDHVEHLLRKAIGIRRANRRKRRRKAS